MPDAPTDEQTPPSPAPVIRRPGQPPEVPTCLTVSGRGWTRDRAAEAIAPHAPPPAAPRQQRPPTPMPAEGGKKMNILPVLMMMLLVLAIAIAITGLVTAARR